MSAAYQPTKHKSYIPVFQILFPNRPVPAETDPRNLRTGLRAFWLRQLQILQTSAKQAGQHYNPPNVKELEQLHKFNTQKNFT